MTKITMKFLNINGISPKEKKILTTLKQNFQMVFMGLIIDDAILEFALIQKIWEIADNIKTVKHQKEFIGIKIDKNGLFKSAVIIKNILLADLMI